MQKGEERVWGLIWVLFVCEGYQMTLVGNRAFPEVWGNRGTRAFSFIGTQEQRPNFEGNRGTDKIFGNREHKKQI